MSILPKRSNRASVVAANFRASLYLIVLLMMTFALPGGWALGDDQPSAATSGPQPDPAMPVRDPSDPPAPKGSIGLTVSNRPAGAVVAYIPIEGPIYSFTVDNFKRRLERARAKTPAPSIIVIRLDTPGGVITDAIALSQFIKQEVKEESICWVNNNATSAGAMIATSCDHIVMSPSGQIGDSAPIAIGLQGIQNLSPTERAKILTPLLGAYASNAQTNGYPYPILHAMCVTGVEVYQLRNKQTGDLRIADQADKYVLVDGLTIDEANAKVDQEFADLSQAASQLASQGMMVTPGQPQVDTVSISNTDRGQYEVVKKLHPTLGKNTLLYFNGQEAVLSGLAETDTVITIAEMQQYLNAGANDYYVIETTWSERIAEFLTRWYIRALLVALLTLGFFIESSFPGTYFGGGLVIFSLVLLIGAPWFIGLAHVWHIVLFFVGIALIVVELFIIPGFGIFGIAGIASVFTGLVLMSVPTSGGGYIPLPAQEFTQRLQWSIASVFFGLILAFILAVVLRLNMKNIPIFSALIFQDQQRRYTGQGANAPKDQLAGDEEVGGNRLAVGDVGKVTSTLRPTGTANFAGSDVDVTCPGQWIDPGKEVRVTAIHGNVIEVEPV